MTNFKRAFYDFFSIPPDATQAQIEAAYANALENLTADKYLRYSTRAASQRQLIEEGYQILGDPARRKVYDGKLFAHKRGIKLMFFPEGIARHCRLGMETVALLLLTAVSCAYGYSQMTHRMETIRAEHKVALEKVKEENSELMMKDDKTGEVVPVRKVASTDQKR